MLKVKTDISLCMAIMLDRLCILGMLYSYAVCGGRHMTVHYSLTVRAGKIC